MRNIEKLRDYFLGKDPYLKETMADNSLRLIGIPGKNFVLRTELMKEAQERKTKDDELTKAISDEEEARINADNTLNDKFDNYYTKTQIDDKIVDDVESNKSADDKAASVRALYNFVADIIQPLTQDITIPENEEINPLLLPTGWHTTGDHVVYYGDSLEPVFGENTLFYFNSEHENQLFYVMPVNALDGWEQLGIRLWFDTWDNVWQYAGYDVRTTIDENSTDMSIPTAAAVATYQTFHWLGNNITLADGSDTINAETGYYNTGAYTVKLNGSDIIGNDKLIRVDINAHRIEVVNPDGDNDYSFIKEFYYYDTDADRWIYPGYKVIRDNSLPDRSDLIPTSSAVYRAIMHTYSATEKQVGIWINDEPLYEKTIEMTVAGGGYEVVSLSGAETAFVKNCFIEDDDDATYKYTYSVPYRYNNNTWVTATIIKNKGTNDVEIELDNQLSHSVTFYATVQYTKID